MRFDLGGVQRLRGNPSLCQNVGGLGRLLHGQRLQQRGTWLDFDFARRVSGTKDVDIRQARRGSGCSASSMGGRNSVSAKYHMNSCSSSGTLRVIST